MSPQTKQNEHQKIELKPHFDSDASFTLVDSPEVQVKLYERLLRMKVRGR
jgi:hypothetical protein